MTSPQRNDIFTICYTSGTTGIPKGVVLTHDNILSELESLEHVGKRGYIFLPRNTDVHMSYLPLAHIFERIVVHYITRFGGCIGFYRGDVKNLMSDMKALKPTIFVSVPRLLNRLYDKTFESVREANGISASIFNYVVKKRMETLRKGWIPYDHWYNLIDKLAFRKLRRQLGGQVRIIVTGSAPLSGKVMDFLRIAFNADVYEGYGQTETSAGISITPTNQTKAGHVGFPLAGFEIKLDPLYPTCTNGNHGEILVRGRPVFTGYYKSPEKTMESFTEDGWYKTGDIGTWDNQRQLVITDRVTSRFKLAQGEYVSPEKVENIILQHCSDVISKIFVTGDPSTSYAVAIVVPNFDGFDEQLSINDKVQEVIEKRIEQIGKDKHLHGFEIPKKITVVDEIPEKLFTPTFKLQRNVARAYYASLIRKMYDTLTK